MEEQEYRGLEDEEFIWGGRWDELMVGEGLSIRVRDAAEGPE